ncbi:HopJ type III effector protein [Thaumasiovibrio subtropicus]|uniref:HopJ type III effector protein n=1 Tax=Thaumasiovibrio subtropicus TaxID=1891207 RepID=UPI000B358DAD|nr:HopJ type III effector protein [Thaumasiovibrio subtropicus]
MEVLIQKLQTQPETVEFDEVIATINRCYEYTPTAFSNGLGDNVLVNAAGTNEGSCRIFAFAKQQNLTEEQTLHCFGHHYRDDVLVNPEGDSHGNIRAFQKHGWQGITFSGTALALKA